MSTKKTSAAESPEQIVEQLRSLIADAEKTIGAGLSEGADETLDALRDRLGDAKERAENYLNAARAKIVQGAKQTDGAIRSHPYESLAIALGVGVLLGAFLGRKSS